MYIKHKLEHSFWEMKLEYNVYIYIYVYIEREEEIKWWHEPIGIYTYKPPPLVASSIKASGSVPYYHKKSMCCLY